MLKEKFMKKGNNKGFSLIELIIAIAILVILTGLLAPNVLRYVEQSRVAKDEQTIDTVREALQASYAEASSLGTWTAPTAGVTATLSSSANVVCSETTGAFATAFTAIVPTTQDTKLGSAKYKSGVTVTLSAAGVISDSRSTTSSSTTPVTNP